MSAFDYSWICNQSNSQQLVDDESRGMSSRMMDAKYIVSTG